MESTITTARLKLTLVTSAPRGSKEFEWIHGLRSNEQSSYWSLYGPSKTSEDTEKSLLNIINDGQPEGDSKKYRIGYAVHEVSASDANSQFIGLISLRSLSPAETQQQPHLGHASTPSTLSLELAYMFLPTSWGKGYATESITALFQACARAESGFWDREKVIVRAIVHDKNAASQRVMEKCMMGGGKGTKEVVEFEGGRFFIAGKWRTEHRLFIYGLHVVG